MLQEPFGNMSTEAEGRSALLWLLLLTDPCLCPPAAEPQWKPEEVCRGQTKKVQIGYRMKRAENGSAGGANK